jgi:hypothetical protein
MMIVFPTFLGCVHNLDEVDTFKKKLALFPIYKSQTTVLAVLLKIECNCISFKSIKLII